MDRENKSGRGEAGAVYGAQTLAQFTDGILKRGFQQYVESRDLGVNDELGIIYQIHGAPQSEEDDRLILKRIENDISIKNRDIAVILLHRPDEIQIRYPQFQEMLKNAARPIGLTFLGDLHVDDFLSARNVIRRVIPHGFFENIPTKLQENPVVVGSHTTWGEMRSTEHLLQLLGHVFRGRTRHDIVGYLGGKPQDQLQIDLLRELWMKHNSDVPVFFEDAHDEKSLDAFRARNVILVDSTNTMPEGLGLTFNVQLYYLNERVRTGESSGSAHSSVSIPVVFEMNGAEYIEDLKVIKIPYGKNGELSTVDYKKGAGLILRSFASKSDRETSYVQMHKHNLVQSRKFTPKYVAEEYMRLFKDLRYRLSL